MNGVKIQNAKEISHINYLKNEKFIIGKKGKDLWYPKYAPHIILDTNKSILDDFYKRK